MNHLLDVEDVYRGYGSLAAVDGVSLRLPYGGRHAVIGPNGAGKTTLLNLVAGLLRPQRGTIRFEGREVTGRGPEARARLGIARTHQQPAVWSSLTVLENVVVAGWQRAGGLRAALTPRRLGTNLVQPALALLNQVELGGCADARAGQLSHGQRRQLEIAMALAGRPRLLLLDEPAAGLSPPELHRLTVLLTSMPASVGILLVEHHLDLVYALADTVTVLRAGRLIITGTPGEIRTSDLARSAYLTAV